VQSGGPLAVSKTSRVSAHSATVPTLQEDQEEDSNDDEGDGSEAAGDAGPNGLVLRPGGRSIEFELPNPETIFRDPHNKDCWTDFTTAQTTFKFDGHTFTRKAAMQRVFLRRKPFMQGGMRLVYGMVLETGVQKPDDMQNMMCAKRLFQDLEKDRGFQAHAAFCKSTAVASYYARKFRAETERLHSKVQLGYLDCQLYSPVGAGEDGYHFCAEAWLKGHFVKLNSNAGFVNEIDYSEHSEIAQAFSHYTFDLSHGELLVVDLQGICGGEGSDLYFLLTDPQVHSRGAFERFGHGDLGDEGICAFFQKHRCGAYCRKLKLRKEYDLRAPTHVLPMPGIEDCISWMLGKDGKDFFPYLRQECRMSSITIPREAHSEWQDIRMWATRRGGTRAQQLLRSRLQDFYDKARLVVPVEPLSPRLWNVKRWRQQLENWRRESGAAIVTWPPDWQEKGVASITELWLFSERQSGAWAHKNRSFAERRIKEVLEAAQGEDVCGEEDVARGNDGGSANASPSATAANGWKRYQDYSNKKYWYHEPDGAWFWESDPQWQQFFDDVSQCAWWWNNSTGTWFYEPKVAPA
jgi:hypothetical protein